MTERNSMTEFLHTYLILGRLSFKEELWAHDVPHAIHYEEHRTDRSLLCKASDIGTDHGH